MNVFFSSHALMRAAQRNLSTDDIQFVIEHGRRQRGAGVLFRQMHAKDMPRHIPPNHPYRRLIGTTVVLCSCGRSVVTVYRNQRAFKRDRSKQKYDLHKEKSSGRCRHCGSEMGDT